MGEISKEAPCSRGSVRRQALKPWMVMCSHGGCWLALFPLCLFHPEGWSISPAPLSFSRWGHRVESGCSFIRAHGAPCCQPGVLQGHGEMLSANILYLTLCCYDVSGIGSGGCVAMENACAFYSQIERCVSKCCSLTLQP